MQPYYDRPKVFVALHKVIDAQSVQHPPPPTPSPRLHLFPHFHST